jgi:hypothetical protein
MLSPPQEEVLQTFVSAELVCWTARPWQAGEAAVILTVRSLATPATAGTQLVERGVLVAAAPHMYQPAVAHRALEERQQNHLCILRTAAFSAPEARAVLGVEVAAGVAITVAVERAGEAAAAGRAIQYILTRCTQPPTMKVTDTL